MSIESFRCVAENAVDLAGTLILATDLLCVLPLYHTRFIPLWYTCGMARPNNIPPLRTGGQLWGPRRVEMGISLRELSKRSGISRGFLSLMENGRMVPRGDEFDRVMEALVQEPEGSVI